MFVLVEAGEGLVLLDVEDQVGEGAEGLSQLVEVAFEVLADEVVGADEGDLSG